MAPTLICRAFEQRRQIGALALASVLGELPSDLPDEAACGLACSEVITEAVGEKVRGGLPGGSHLVPGAQRGECRGIGESIGGGQVSGHFGGSEFCTRIIVQG
ncbi:hypothetical protein D9M70_548990 [compost metagenome]